ncbi:hypothetical protein CDL12_18599 [Handroanthus impetiginosus]|uniref:Pectinesterase inhibitor domain-containing protein n=1 Tax=Handroanthus impetiginosus TaxID=429701 RepID=A0A2G9GU79_9LAMI|nr:hypothetical protein CDL12_18599 [Handroanthus impetiginosus]
MAYLNPRIAALVLALSIALISSAAADSLSVQAEQAKDVQYLKAQMTAAVNKVEQFRKTVVAKRLKDPSIDSSTKECVKVCQEVYDGAIDAMKKGMKSVQSGDFFKANFDVSAFFTNIDTCDDCFSEFQQFDQWAKGVGSACLDKIVKYRS